MTENRKNVVQQMAERIMPGFKTDHGEINLGDILALMLDAVLLFYTGYRSWHFLSLSLPPEFQILAIVGVVGIDIGMVIWSAIWIFGSTSKGQDGISLTMWIVDAMAMTITSVVDTVMYADGGGFPPIAQTLAWYGVPLIIVSNAVMGVIYHFVSPITKNKRQGRKFQAHMQEVGQKGQSEIDEITETARILKDFTGQRAQALMSIASVTQQNLAMAELEQQLIKQLGQAGMGHLTDALSELGMGKKNEKEKEDKTPDAVQATIAQIRDLMNRPSESNVTSSSGPELTPVPVPTAGFNGHDGGKSNLDPH